MATNVTGISLNYSTYTVSLYREESSSFELSYDIVPATATNQSVVWHSDNTSVATVTNEGLVTVYRSGIVRIFVATVDGDFRASCLVTTRRLMDTLILSDSAVTIDRNESFTLTATTLPEDADEQVVRWGISNGSAIDIVPIQGTLNRSVVVTALNSGTSLLTASVEFASASCSVEVTTNDTRFRWITKDTSAEYTYVTYDSLTSTFAALRHSYTTTYDVEYQLMYLSDATGTVQLSPTSSGEDFQLLQGGGAGLYVINENMEEDTGGNRTKLGPLKVATDYQSYTKPSLATLSKYTATASNGTYTVLMGRRVQSASFAYKAAQCTNGSGWTEAQVQVDTWQYNYVPAYKGYFANGYFLFGCAGGEIAYTNNPYSNSSSAWTRRTIGSTSLTLTSVAGSNSMWCVASGYGNTLYTSASVSGAFTQNPYVTTSTIDGSITCLAYLSSSNLFFMGTDAGYVYYTQNPAGQWTYATKLMTRISDMATGALNGIQYIGITGAEGLIVGYDTQ